MSQYDQLMPVHILPGQLRCYFASDVRAHAVVPRREP